MSAKKILGLLLALSFAGIAAAATIVFVLASNLPQLITLEDYKPLLVSEVFDREGNKVGEFFREKRILIPYKDLPEVVTQAFVSSEDSSFFQHSGINPIAMVRAFIANIKAGRKVQGGSTITMQVARSLLLTSKKTYTRKIKEVILAYRMENNLSKQDILFLYLNQIYLGQGAYGIGMASQIYFRKPVAEITLGEAALLAGLPQAPSRYTPIYKPSAAKTRQKYVLRRMAEEEYVTEEVAQQAADLPLEVYVRKNYKELAPYYMETLRQMLVKRLGEDMVLDKGIKVFTGIDLNKQLEAQKQVRSGLRNLDKRQGWRGAKKNFEDTKEIAEFLLKSRNRLMDDLSSLRILKPDGTIEEKGPLNITGKDENGEALPNVPSFLSIDQIVPAIVTDVNDKWGLVSVRFAESKGLVDIDTMKWAREPDPAIRSDHDEIGKPSAALKKGDIIEVRIVGKKFRSERLREKVAELRKNFRKSKKNKGKKFEQPEDLPDFTEFANVELEQEPIAEGALLSLDQKSGEVIAMVGGYDFARSKWNKVTQATRQTGSSFKPLVYASALDKGYTPATAIIDAPIVYEEENKPTDEEALDGEESLAEATSAKRWRPMNHSKRFIGDILFRNALIRSMNVPSVKVIEKIGVEWAADYARRLGMFSPLNMDFTLALGSSSVTLYEITKAFSQIGNLGRRIKPLLIHKVEDQEGKILIENLTLDDRFADELEKLEEEFEERRLAYLDYKKDHPEAEFNPTSDSSESTTDKTTDANAKADSDKDPAQAKVAKLRNPSKEPPLFFNDPDQLMKKETAYVITSILQGAVEERGGTGGQARALGRPVAGKTGSTSGYFDAWFVGFTPDISTGVWVGFDQEKSLGKGEVGGRSALPIWLEYMKMAHEGLPTRNFTVPEGIVFANIDNKTGKLASTTSKQVVRQAFIEGSEPTQMTDEADSEEDKNFFKEEFSE